MAGTSFQPVPWWQTGDSSKYTKDPGAALGNLKSSAPDGYEYNPVDMKYERTPASAGGRVAAFTGAALGGIPSLNGLFGGGSTSGSTSLGGLTGGAPGAPGAGGPVGGGSYTPSLKMPDMTQSNDATFAAAKDKVGQMSRASLDSLNGELGSQGMLGSGAQADATRSIVANGQGELGQVARDSATTNANMAADFAKTGYEGSITQRGQDINAQEANARLAQEGRLGDAQIALQKQNQQFQLLSTILNGISGVRSSALSASGGLY